MLRGCYDGLKPRKSALPFHGHPGGAFWIGTPLDAAQAVVLTESAIEVLSYAALHPTALTSSNIHGGNRWRHVLRIFPQVSHLVIAFNADDEGKAAAGELQEYARSEGISVVLHLPTQKDWNNELKARQDLGSAA
jgi:MarR-like DNA-binding transcriptional regulator SgrR of sgrS sRNA